MQDEASISRVKQTFEDWSMFEAVIRNDYMHHQEIADGLGKVAAELMAPLRIVDLGCGDAWMAAHAFASAPIEKYAGVDLSESAIQRLRANLSAWGSRATGYCQNMAQFVAEQPDGSANLILASNSLHHFDSEHKALLAAQCFRILAPRGVFCWIDPVRQAGESREAFLQRLTVEIRDEWTALSIEQRGRAVEHIWASDFPETESWMRDHAVAAGFELAGQFYRDEFFIAWQFVKP